MSMLQVPGPGSGIGEGRSKQEGALILRSSSISFLGWRDLSQYLPQGKLSPISLGTSDVGSHEEVAETS